MTVFAVCVKEERFKFVDVEAETIEDAAAVALGRKRKGARATYIGNWIRDKKTFRVAYANAPGEWPPPLTDWRPS